MVYLLKLIVNIKMPKSVSVISFEILYILIYTKFLIRDIIHLESQLGGIML